MSRAMGALVLTVIFVAWALPGAGAQPSPAVPPDLVQLGTVTAPVYRVSLRLEGPRTTRWSEVVAPQSQHCRREDGEGRVEIVGGRTRAIVDSRGVQVRTGSSAFAVGRGGVPCASLAPLAAQLRGGKAAQVGDELSFDWRGFAVVATIGEELAPDEVARLFAVPVDRLVTYDIERSVGERRFRPVRAYWLGRTFFARRATRAIEHFDHYDLGPVGSRPPSTLLSVLYGPRGATPSGEPGRRPADEALQVSSQPVGEALARRTVEHFTRLRTRFRQPHYSIRLASGERAIAYPNLGEGRNPVIGFVVVTETTLVSVGGRFRLSEVPAVARQLRPLEP